MKNKLSKLLKIILLVILYLILFFLLLWINLDLRNHFGNYTIIKSMYILIDLNKFLNTEITKYYGVETCFQAFPIDDCKNPLFNIIIFFITFIVVFIKIKKIQLKSYNFLKIIKKHNIIIFIISFQISVFFTFHLLNFLILSYLKISFFLNKEILIFLFNN